MRCLAIKGLMAAFVALLLSTTAHATLVTFSGSITEIASNGSPIPPSIDSNSFSGSFEYDPYAQVGGKIFSNIFISFGSWGIERTAPTIDSVGVQKITTDNILYTDTISPGLWGTAFDVGYYLEEVTLGFFNPSADTEIGDGSFINFNDFTSRTVFLSLNSIPHTATISVLGQIDSISVPESATWVLFICGLGCMVLIKRRPVRREQR